MPGLVPGMHVLERFPITLNREALWFYRFGRIFFGKPVATFPENALVAE
jgi:hypothetical protein